MKALFDPHIVDNRLHIHKFSLHTKPLMRIYIMFFPLQNMCLMLPFQPLATLSDPSLFCCQKW